MKSPRSASSRRSSSSVSRMSAEIGSTSCSVTRWVSAETKRVVDEHDAVDLALGEELGDTVRDRLRVAVRRPVGEARRRRRPARTRRKVSVERPFLPTASQRTSLPSCAQLALERERAPQHLRVERAGEPAVARERHDGHRPTSPRAAASSGRPRTELAARPTPAISSLIVSAYGRIASIRRLGAPQLRRRDELHRARDLARVADGADAALDVLDRAIADLGIRQTRR